MGASHASWSNTKSRIFDLDFQCLFVSKVFKAEQLPIFWLHLESDLDQYDTGSLLKDYNDSHDSFFRR